MRTWSSRRAVRSSSRPGSVVSAQHRKGLAEEVKDYFSRREAELNEESEKVSAPFDAQIDLSRPRRRPRRLRSSARPSSIPRSSAPRRPSESRRSRSSSRARR